LLRKEDVKLSSKATPTWGSGSQRRSWNRKAVKPYTALTGWLWGLRNLRMAKYARNTYGSASIKYSNGQCTPASSSLAHAESWNRSITFSANSSNVLRHWSRSSRPWPNRRNTSPVAQASFIAICSNKKKIYIIEVLSYQLGMTATRRIFHPAR
jgi:hypothetical protein